MSSHMHAIQYTSFGGPEVLHLVQTAIPVPRPGQIRIRVRSCGVNPSDWKCRAGLHQTFDGVVFPAGVGVEASGIVDHVPNGVSGVSPGDAVFGFGRDTAAEYAILTHWVKKPEDMPFAVAAGIPVICETAMRALDAADLLTGETLLANGAAGGIGTALIQMARQRGLLVIGTASAAKHGYLRGLGAIPTTYGPGLAGRVRQLAPQGVTAATDVAGSGCIPELIQITGAPERVVSLTEPSAEMYGAIFSHGPPKDPVRVLEHMVRMWRGGIFRLHIDRSFPLAETARAQQLSAAGHVTGKLIITVSGSRGKQRF